MPSALAPRSNVCEALDSASTMARRSVALPDLGGEEGAGEREEHRHHRNEGRRDAAATAEQSAAGLSSNSQ